MSLLIHPFALIDLILFGVSWLFWDGGVGKTGGIGLAPETN